jgi:hypothetical protein
MEMDAERGIFVGGDLMTGPMTVIDAIASGRKGAVLIDKFLGGEGDMDQVFAAAGPATLWTGEASIEGSRAPMPMLAAAERVSSFSEVGLGLEGQAAMAEAVRCLGCDLRFQIEPVVLPPERWFALSDEGIQDVPETEGVYVLYDEQKEIYKISGVENIRQALLEECESGSAAKYFSYEEDPMFTGKERQLVQQYMKKTGSMPPGHDELDDLF